MRFFNKKILIAITIGLASTLALVVSISYLLPKPTAYEFGGEIVKFEEGSVILRGDFKMKDGTTPNRMIQATAALSSKTKYTKKTFYLPEAGTIYYQQELRNEITEGSLEDLKTNGTAGGIMVRSNKNIYNKEIFEAVEVFYYNEVIPE
jgi:hypothetical protein